MFLFALCQFTVEIDEDEEEEPSMQSKSMKSTSIGTTSPDAFTNDFKSNNFESNNLNQTNLTKKNLKSQNLKTKNLKRKNIKSMKSASNKSKSKGKKDTNKGWRTTHLHCHLCLEKGRKKKLRRYYIEDLNGDRWCDGCCSIDITDSDCQDHKIAGKTYQCCNGHDFCESCYDKMRSGTN